METPVSRMTEQRDRSRMALQAKLVLHDENREFFLKGVTRDISMKGLYVKSEVGFPLGSKCHIEIIVTARYAELTIKLLGTVVRREREGYGVLFEKDLEFWPLLAMLK